MSDDSTQSGCANKEHQKNYSNSGGANSHSAEHSSNRDEAIFGVQKASLNMFWEYSPFSANLASDWLKAKTALLWMRKREKSKWMTVSLLYSLRKEPAYLLTCGRRSLVSGTQNDIVVR